MATKKSTPEEDASTFDILVPESRIQDKWREIRRARSTMICIYCKEEKSEVKGVEHVIPQSFGRFGSKTPTLRCVCDECNAYFARELDLRLARETLEGITRYKQGIFSREIRPQKTLRITLGEEAGEFAGVVIEGVDGTTGRLLKPLPQVHFLNEKTGKREAVLKEGISGLDWKKRNYSLKGLRVFAPSEEEHTAIVSELAKAGIPFTRKSELRPKFLEGRKEGDTVDIGVNIEGVIDHPTKRALLKVLFNFAAYYLGSDEVLKGQWDKARHYIRYDGDPIGARISNKPFWVNEAEDWRYSSDSCNIRVENENANVIGTIQFYNLYTHEFKLVENYSVSKEVAARFTPGEEPQLGTRVYRI
jgi:hypothetical protein